MVCFQCGYWNDNSEHRCARCGRRLQMNQRGSWTRSRLEQSDPLSQALPSPDEEPLPPPRPVWKQELNRKLEGYRDRQKLTQQGARSAAPATLPEPAQGASPSRSTPIAFSKASIGGAGAAAAPAREAPSGTPDPGLDRPWRRVVKAPPEQRLPPLRKSAPAATAPEQAAAGRLHSPKASARAREVASDQAVAPVPIRALAAVLDLAVILVALGVFMGVFALVGRTTLSGREGFEAMGFAFFTIMSFYWVFYLRYLGETSGMMWLGLQVLNFDGQPPTEAQRRARALGTILSTASLGLGFAWAVADEEKLSWHDRISKTFITRNSPSGFRARPSQPSHSGRRSAALPFRAASEEHGRPISRSSL